ncbi:MAG: DHHA1 domain-containing protein [Isosphaeraceae bacterium]
MIGIVAGRLADTFHRPSVVVALDPNLSQGSARSVAGFDLYEALKACSTGLTGFGGHKAAAGLRLPAAFFPTFAERFDHHCRAALTP